MNGEKEIGREGEGREGEVESRRVGKSEFFAFYYGKPSTDRPDDGGVAQVTSASDWYALANDLAEKALADTGGRDAEADGSSDRGNEEV